MTTWRDDLSRLAEEVEEAGMAEAWSGYWISSRVRTLLASHPESAPAPGPGSDEALARSMAAALHAGINAWDWGNSPGRKAALEHMMDALHAWERREG